MKAAIALLTGLALIGGEAQAAKPPCVEHRDMRLLLRLALPEAVEALADRCRSELPADAFLPNEGAGLANRLRSQDPVDLAEARGAFERATGQDLSSFASDDTVRSLARQYVDDQITQHVSVKDCPQIDTMMELAGTLRTSTMADALLLVLAAAGPDQVKGVAICRPKDEGEP